MATFDELRKEARKLETTLDLKLVSYSKFGANFAHSSLLREGSSDTVSLLKNSEHVANSMALEVEQLLSKLSELNEEMGRCATAINYPHHLQHHRQKLHEYSQEFNKTRSNILATREHAELLISVQQDITNIKNSGFSSRTDSLLRERSSIHGSDHVLDLLTGQAQDVREAVASQRNFLRGTISKLSIVGGKLPGISSLIGTIRKKKSRDCLILSLFIAFCICFILFYWLRN
ncbi:Golgi SNAP receptor complex member 1 [Balamuthia mandrillaris]